ncbi:MAG: hypothetical protein GY696_05685 [Gammaproteobacteria bacterium]|nr:hypothetical protein [Gammaproteobacteria bacterium]
MIESHKLKALPGYGTDIVVRVYTIFFLATQNAKKCCGTCKKNMDCNVWNWEIESKKCVLMNAYDYAHESTTHKGSKIRAEGLKFDSKSDGV